MPPRFADERTRFGRARHSTDLASGVKAAMHGGALPGVCDLRRNRSPRLLKLTSRGPVSC